MENISTNVLEIDIIRATAEMILEGWGMPLPLENLKSILEALEALTVDLAVMCWLIDNKEFNKLAETLKKAVENGEGILDAIRQIIAQTETSSD